MLRIWVKTPDGNGKRMRWEEIPNGPFPITAAELEEARKRFAGKRAMAKDIDQLGGCWVTEARSILKQICPHLCSFDLLCLGHAVGMETVRWKEGD